MNFFIDTNKQTVFNAVTNFLKEKNLGIASEDDNRPWGGFFVIDEKEPIFLSQLFFRTSLMKN